TTVNFSGRLFRTSSASCGTVTRCPDTSTTARVTPLLTTGYHAPWRSSPSSSSRLSAYHTRAQPSGWSSMDLLIAVFGLPFRDLGNIPGARAWYPGPRPGGYIRLSGAAARRWTVAPRTGSRWHDGCARKGDYAAYHLDRRDLSRSRYGQGLGVRSRPAVRRRRVRGHPGLQPPRLSLGPALGPALRLRERRVARGAACQAGAAPAGGRSGHEERARRGLYSPAGHTRRRRPGAGPAEMPQGVRHLHRRHDPAVAARPLRQGARCAHCRDTDPSPREPLASHQIAQLPVTHPRQ